MATSENGVDEMRKRNNHGVFYDFYLVHFALFAGMDGVAAELVDGFLEYCLGVQMDKQGRFSEELKRTRSWHYSNDVVKGAAKLATLTECVNCDLWDAQLEDGRGCRRHLPFSPSIEGAKLSGLSRIETEMRAVPRKWNNDSNGCRSCSTAAVPISMALG